MRVLIPFFFSLLFAENICAQIVEYVIDAESLTGSFDMFHGELERSNNDGSILFSRNFNDTIAVDSISPQGAVFNIYERVFPDTYSISGYVFDESLNLYIVNRVQTKAPDGSATDFLTKHLEYYPIDSSTFKWRVKPRTYPFYWHTENSYEPYIIDSLLYLLGGVMSDGDCNPSLDYFIYSINGDSIGFGSGEFSNSCKGVVSNFEESVFISGKRCTCSGSTSGGGVLNKFNSDTTTSILQHGRIYDNNGNHIFNVPWLFPLSEELSWGISTGMYSAEGQEAYIFLPNEIQLNVNQFFNFSSEEEVVDMKLLGNDVFILSLVNSYSQSTGETFEFYLHSYHLINGTKSKVQVYSDFGRVYTGLFPIGGIYGIHESSGIDKDFYISYRSNLNGEIKDYLMRYTLPNSALGILDAYNEEQVSIYPNPTSGQFTLQSDEPGYYSILNLSGQLIQEGVFRVGENRVELDGSRPQGVYFIRMDTHLGKVITRKLVLSN